MYVNENMSGVSDVLGVMKAKHFYENTSLAPSSKNTLTHEILLRVPRVKNLFAHIIPLPSSPFDSFNKEGNQKSESVNNRGFHLTTKKFSILLNKLHSTSKCNARGKDLCWGFKV
jgi:hypothetical protein